MGKREKARNLGMSEAMGVERGLGSQSLHLVGSISAAHSRLVIEPMHLVDEFTLLSALWVIRARSREIQRFVRKFKTMKSTHDLQFWVFHFPKHALKGAAE